MLNHPAWRLHATDIPSKYIIPEILYKRSDSEQYQGSPGEIVVYKLNLTSLASVRECAKRLLENESKIHLLINNAGVMMCPKEITEDGYECQLQSNHIGHFLLTLLLLPKIKESTPGCRIVSVSSLAHVGRCTLKTAFLISNFQTHIECLHVSITLVYTPILNLIHVVECVITSHTLQSVISSLCNLKFKLTVRSQREAIDACKWAYILCTCFESLFFQGCTLCTLLMEIKMTWN